MKDKQALEPMCRLLMVRAARAFDTRPHLEALAEIARASKEYQGHGWGFAWLAEGKWRMYHNIAPIWDDPRDVCPATTALVAHARSAFRDEGIVVENNMPFGDGHTVFAFNGELRGVRIKAEGRIGAEKIYNTIKRFDKGDLLEALGRGTQVINKRTRYVRAMNIVMASPGQGLVSSHFGEDPNYFALRRKTEDGLQIVCSEPYPGTDGWETVENGAVYAQ